MMDELSEAVEMQRADFGLALAHVKEGGKAARVGWEPGGMWIRMVVPEGTSDYDYGMENKPYLELKTTDDKLIPWTATHEDLLAEDWMLFDDPEE